MMYYKVRRRMLNFSLGGAGEQKQRLGCCMMPIKYSHQHADGVKISFSESDPSGTEFGEAVCHFFFFFFFLSPGVAADGAPLPGDTDRDTET